MFLHNRIFINSLALFVKGEFLIRVPKVPFRVSDKLKNESQKIDYHFHV